MKNNLLLGCLAAILILAVASCKKTSEDPILEPITIVSPDSTIVFVSKGKTQKIELKFTTDRPINYAQALYEIDTTGNVNYSYTYPDTLFFERLDSTGMTPNNKFDYVGGYTVPDSLKNGYKVRFKATLKADKLIYNKEFLIRVKN